MSAPPWPTGPVPAAGEQGTAVTATGTGAGADPWSSPRTERPGSGWRPTRPRTVDTTGAGVLMLACLGLHIGAMFPPYIGDPPASVASLPHDIAMYVCLEVGWAVAAVLVLAGSEARAGTALGAGLGAVETGLLATDVVVFFEQPSSSSAGLWLAVAGLGAGLAGVLLAASSLDMGSPRSSPGRAVPARSTATVLLAVMAVVTFWLSWDSGRIFNSAGQSTAVNGNAFSQPVGLATVTVITGLVIGLVIVLASYWSPAGVGAWAVVGVVIALASQLTTAYVEVHEPLRDAVNNGSSSGLDAARSTLGLTADWAANVAAAVALLVVAVWAGLEGRASLTTDGGDAHGTWPRGPAEGPGPTPGEGNGWRGGGGNRPAGGHSWPEGAGERSEGGNGGPGSGGPGS
ncbi:MAG: hypothetical protein ACRDZX_15245 [Acidimicrobiales bacterium]